MTAGLCTFSILGALSHELHLPIDDVLESGMGLAFVGFPDAIGRFKDLPQVRIFLLQKNQSNFSTSILSKYNSLNF